MSLVHVGTALTEATPTPAHMVRYGTGARVFAGLHGWSGSCRSFEPLLGYMPDDVSFFAVDQPGFGQTPRPERWTLSHLVAPVVTSFERLPDEPITLVGHCAGAIVALHAALRLGSRVRRVILIDPFSHAPWYFSIFDWPVVGGLFYLVAFANPLGRKVTSHGLRDVRTSSTDLVEGFRTVRHVDNWRYLRVLVRSARFGVRPFVPYRGEVDVLYGARTFTAIRRSVADWRSIWPHLSEFEIEGAGHLPIHEAPENMARVVFRDPSEPQPERRG